MKNIWLWIVGILAAIFLYSKYKSNQAATTQAIAGQGLATNPLSNFWNFSNLFSAAGNSAGAASAQTAQASLGAQVLSIFGFGAKGGNAPSTAGSGTVAPQVPANVQPAPGIGSIVQSDFGAAGSTLQLFGM